MALAGILTLVYRFVVPVEQWLLGLIVLASIGFVVFGAHVLLVAAAPMDFGTRKAAASATGFIDGWGYVGAGLQCVIVGLFVDRWGWDAGFIFWVISAFLAAGLMLFLWKHKPPKKKYL
jgi:sugar phosphate permease